MMQVGGEPHRIQISTGKHWSSPFTWSGARSHPLVVEHPNEPGLNLAHCLRNPNWQEILTCCRTAHSTFSYVATSVDVDALQAVFRPRSTPTAAAILPATANFGDDVLPAAKRPRLQATVANKQGDC